MSTTGTTPLFGRRYDIQVTLQKEVLTIASDSFEPEQLKVTFDIQQVAFQTLWTAYISVYNLDQETNAKIMREVNWQGMRVTVRAGYQGYPRGYGVIWDGPVFQTLFERENVVDYKLTLVCILGLWDVAGNFVNKTFAAGFTQADYAAKIADSAFNKIGVARIASTIKPNKLSRAKTVFGNPGRYFTQIAEDNNLQWWLSNKGLSITGITDANAIPAEPSLTFSPPSLPVGNFAGQGSTPTDGIIIGTPQQTPFGITMMALLDARMQVQVPFVKFKIDNTLIRRMKQLINPNDSQIPVLDEDGIYIVSGARFYGDTRGNDWYVQVDGFTSLEAKTALMRLAATANTNNAGPQ